MADEMMKYGRDEIWLGWNMADDSPSIVEIKVNRSKQNSAVSFSVELWSGIIG